MSWTLEEAALVGEVLSGGGTVVLLFIALGWRRDRLDERRGDAAARALVSLKRNCNLARGWCALLQYEVQADDPVLAPLAAQSAFKFFQGVEKSVAAAVDELEEAQVSCVALLMDDETKPLYDLQGMLNLFVNEVSGCFIRLDGGARGECPAGNAAVSMAAAKYASSFREIEVVGMAVLRPVAQLRARQTKLHALWTWLLDHVRPGCH